MVYPQLEEIIPKRAENYYKSRYPEFVQYLHDIYPDVTAFNEKLYWFYHNITEQPKCKICGGKVSFRGFNYGYSEYCSSKCASKDPERSLKIQQTILERYGVAGYNNREKAKQTCLEKYGVENPYQAEEVKEKIKQGYLEKYNVEHPSQSQEIQETRRKNSLEKYGVDHHMKVEEVKQKVSKGLHNFYVEHIDGLIGYDENGNHIRICPHPECKKCSEKFYITPHEIDYTRKRLGLEPCTRILQVSRSHAKGTTLEIFIRNILDEYNIEYTTNDRSIGVELDIYIPSKSLAIECNGCFWHSEQHKHDPKIHINKYKKCLENNIQLLTIWEDWIRLKPEIVKSIILNKLGLTPNKIYGRCCTIRDVSSKDAIKFLNENHIQGQANSMVKLGLYYKDQLVSLMTFTKRSKLSGGQKDDAWELNRFCNKLYTNIIGGASKLLKEFMRRFSGKIVSHASNDISNGNLYKSLGFTTDGKITEAYWYIDKNTYQRHHRTAFTKSKLKAMGYEGGTEFEIMSKLPFWKIYDSGHIKYVMYN